MKKVVGLALISLSGCMQAVTEESVTHFRDGVGPGTLCGIIEAQREVSEKSTEMNLLISEYGRRNPSVSNEWLSDLREGLVSIGMPEEVAACSWNGYVIGHSIGYGQNTKQYKGYGSDSYFFVNGRTGKVDYISS